MNKQTLLQNNLITSRSVSLLVLGCLLVSVTPVNAETVVSNSVSVSANGNDDNHTAVTTIINGEVIEDWSETSAEPISYSNTYTASSSSKISVETQTGDQQLKAMIAQLEAIISFYVSLLNY